MTNKNEYVCSVFGTTPLGALSAFCKEMFEDEREIDSNTVSGDAFSNNGMSFMLKDGVHTYKTFYRNRNKMFEFFIVR